MPQSLSSKKMVCRKLLSSKSSSRKSSRGSMFLSTSTMNRESESYKKNRSMFSCSLSIIIHILIIYYLINLEDVTCNCIIDWRHNYIKYVTIFILAMNILFLFNIKLSNSSNDNPIMTIFLILSLVNMYALYTYVGDLNDTKCGCAVDKQKDLNTFLYYYRYLFIIMPILLIIGVIMLLTTLR